MQQDGMATLAPNVRAAFAALTLDEDPLLSRGNYYAGIDLLEYLDERIAEHGLGQALADQLIAFYRRAFVDWRPLLESGTWGDAPRAMNRAIRYAIATDDATLIGQLAAAGVRFDQALRGRAKPIDDALISHAFAAVDALMTAGAVVPASALQQINRAIPAPLVARLLHHGAQADAMAIARCVACGSADSARLIARACHDDVSADYAAASQAMRERYEADLCKVQTGKLGHYLGADGLAERIEHLRRFVL
ncbi:hypothetical protein [Dyella silvatica]|uniref:hypothetical protein n=1 Tax=Dyella silvatica TaxID=2992128 RepID=UPI00224FBFF2|nr:hypothetical protein [Dyella silvatica]